MNQNAQQSRPVKRRTQQERTASTKRILLEATVRCVERKGYSSTTISQIVEEAGVSRGALLHHYPSKIDLVAAAMNDFYRKLGAEVDLLLKKIKPDEDCLRKKLDIVNEIYGKNASVRIEFMVAARTDPELARAFLDQQEGNFNDLYPEISHLENAGQIRSAISAFLLGNSLLDALQEGESKPTFELFASMLEKFIESQAQP